MSRLWFHAARLLPRRLVTAVLMRVMDECGPEDDANARARMPLRIALRCWAGRRRWSGASVARTVSCPRCHRPVTAWPDQTVTVD